MDKYIGKTLNERYILTELVGAGGMALVYKAFDKLVNRIVAVKILKEEFMSDAQFRRRFSNESKAITMLSQKNIVDVYDVCLDGDIMYIVMEFIDGITLKEYIDKKHVIEWREAVHYSKQILQALAHAHERGIVHRDIKPHNIMLLSDGTIKVTDFGIARLSKFDTQTITDKAIGSVHYISPEQASGDTTDEKTDIYSLGVMLYEMLTGKLPFEADSPVSVALMQVQAQPVLPREINDRIPQGIEEITIRAMMKNPDERYQSARDMIEDISRVEENPYIIFHYLDNISEDNSPTKYVDLDEHPEEQPEQPKTDNDDENNFKSTWLPVIGGVATAIGLLTVIIIAIIVIPNLKAGKKVEQIMVPNFVDENYDEAVLSAAGLGFTIEIQSRELSDKEKDTILSQDPKEGQTVDRNGVVKVVVSLGVETAQVPSVATMDLTEALNEFNRLGIKTVVEKRFSETVAEGRVISTDPTANTEITSDQIVTVYVSLGPETKKVKVPDLSKMTEANAKKELEKNNLVLGKIRNDYHDTIAEGLVIRQYTDADTEVNENTSIDILISLGPRPIDNNNDNDDDNDNSNNNDVIDVPFKISYDMKAYQTLSSVDIKIIAISPTGITVWDEDMHIEMADLAATDLIFVSDEKILPIDTVVTFYINNTVVQTYTVK